MSLNGWAGKTIGTNLGVSVEGNTPKGVNWDSRIADIALVSVDGTVHTLFNQQNVSASTGNSSSGSNFAILTSTDTVPETHFYLGDHLGTAQMEFAGEGWPVWQGQFAPFGAELDSQTTANHYKFTGKERDTESGLDYFGARYYGSNMGRWMSPDILNVTEDRLMNPSSTLNKYAYGANNPLRYVDPDGKDITVFYDPTGVTHLALAAYDPQTGKGAFESFAPQDHSLGSQAKELLGADASGSVSDYKVSDYGNADFLRSNYASLTIQTSPEVTQEAINFINSHPDGNWNMYTNNCSTACLRVLKDIGLIGGGHFTPHAVWSTLVSKYEKQNGFRNFMAQHNPSRGTEYGNPRPGVNPFDFLRLMMQHCTTETVTVTINGTSTSSSHQNCSQ